MAAHGELGGEEDWVHEGPLPSDDRHVAARLRMSVDPEQGVVDGPYVVVGCAEFTLAEARALGTSLLTLTDASGAPAAG